MTSLGNNNNNSSFSPPIPNRPNLKPRNSESADPMRRSFGGNPFPAKPRVNIPSDISRRNSCGSKLELSDKENNETKPFPTPKGSKNFMSPTISTVSKINPSPRKKVLSDRNGMSRSFDDTKSNNNQAKSCDEKKQFQESYDMTITDFEDKEEILYSDPRFRISPRPSLPYASPEFAAAPYDPKNNYLSPRPQFLHYKPNPRIECKQLDELFISESFSSDNDLSAEETENNEEQEKEVEIEAVVEETEDVEETSQVEQLMEDEAEAVVVEEEETGNVEELEAESDEEMVCESIEESTQVPKQFGFTKIKFLGCFFALAMAYLLVSATFSPTTKLVILQELSSYEFHIPEKITEFAKAKNLEHLSEKLWSFTESSIVYIDKLISRLGGGKEEYGPLKFYNLTDTPLEDYNVFKPTSVEISVVPALVHVEEPEEQPLQEKIQDENNLEDGYFNEYEETEEPLQEKSQGENNHEDGHVNEYKEEIIGEENSEVVCETKDGDADTNNESDEQSEIKLEAIFEEDALAKPLKLMIVLSSSVLILLASVAFLFSKKVKLVAASDPETTEKQKLGHVTEENEMKEKLSEVDDNSFHKKSSFFNNKKDPKEHQRSLSNLRRESLASSASEYSVGSFSYGSFTTYEKIPIKTGDKEEEMITPVRRSSRLRNHHQSSSGL